MTQRGALERLTTTDHPPKEETTYLFPPRDEINPKNVCDILNNLIDLVFRGADPLTIRRIAQEAGVDILPNNKNDLGPTDIAQLQKGAAIAQTALPGTSKDYYDLVLTCIPDAVPNNINTLARLIWAGAEISQNQSGTTRGPDPRAELIDVASKLTPEVLSCLSDAYSDYLRQKRWEPGLNPNQAAQMGKVL